MSSSGRESSGRHQLAARASSQAAGQHQAAAPSQLARLDYHHTKLPSVDCLERGLANCQLADAPGHLHRPEAHSNEQVYRQQQQPMSGKKQAGADLHFVSQPADFRHHQQQQHHWQNHQAGAQLRHHWQPNGLPADNWHSSAADHLPNQAVCQQHSARREAGRYLASTGTTNHANHNNNNHFGQPDNAPGALRGLEPTHSAYYHFANAELAANGHELATHLDRRHQHQHQAPDCLQYAGQLRQTSSRLAQNSYRPNASQPGQQNSRPGPEQAVQVQQARCPGQLGGGGQPRGSMMMQQEMAANGAPRSSESGLAKTPPGRAPEEAKRPAAARPHVNFNRSSQAANGLDEADDSAGESRKKKYLTAKYGQQQMNLIKKRLKIEMWLYERLQELAKEAQSKADLDEIDIDLDQLLDMEDDETRRRWLKKILEPFEGTPGDKLNEFIDNVLEQSKLL